MGGRVRYGASKRAPSFGVGCVLVARPGQVRSGGVHSRLVEGSGGRSAGIYTWILLGETLGFWVGLRSARAVDGMMVQKSGVRGFPGGRRTDGG